MKDAKVELEKCLRCWNIKAKGFRCPYCQSRGAKEVFSKYENNYRPHRK